jgi:hypothetical protein
MGDRRKCQTFAASPAEPGVSRLCQDFLLEEPKRSFAQIEPERFRDTEFLCSVVANSAGTERLRNSDIQPPQRSFELGGALPDRRRFDMTWLLALQLFLPASSESMGNHDSDIVDADGVG